MATSSITRHEIGVRNLRWGNDWPHHDSIWPKSMKVLRKLISDVAADDIERRCFANTVERYDIDAAKLPA